MNNENTQYTKLLKMMFEFGIVEGQERQKGLGRCNFEDYLKELPPTKPEQKQPTAEDVKPKAETWFTGHGVPKTEDGFYKFSFDEICDLLNMFGRIVIMLHEPKQQQPAPQQEQKQPTDVQEVDMDRWCADNIQHYGLMDGIRKQQLRQALRDMMQEAVQQVREEVKHKLDSIEMANRIIIQDLKDQLKAQLTDVSNEQKKDSIDVAELFSKFKQVEIDGKHYVELPPIKFSGTIEWTGYKYDSRTNEWTKYPKTDPK